MVPATPDPIPDTISRHGLVVETAEVILAVYDAYQAQFGLVTRRAVARFIHRDWRGGQQDAMERLTLYRQFVNWVVQDLKRSLGPAHAELPFWQALRTQYARLAANQPNPELALTFFNSVARQLVRVSGPASGVYFEDADFRALPAAPVEQVLRIYVARGRIEPVIEQVLRDLPFSLLFRDLELDARLTAEALAEELRRQSGDAALDAIEVVPVPFYRNKGAYLIGRLRTGGAYLPLVLPLVHGDYGVEVDAVLATSDEVSIVFSFTRSYFQVELDSPRAMVDFLRTLMPQKPIDELYTSLGYHKHGKTELVRALLRNLAKGDGRFELAPGDKGLVMSVFALPSLNVVFKVIRDHFGAPKTTTRQEVMSKYHLVFLRDRVGRLADA
ncbi:MAG TPA: isocitrate dehydrogenase kinase/phosphatase AceK regulatory subunit, partial [Gemmatimonadales bacterium]|nr:isocitrate dehydrogenase kinase/phosphatase AceK regulatory subunit [Gemmatimonadales bacterium]